jgi:hypothetical protein
MVNSKERYVQLKNGPVLPVQPVLLMFELQDRGFSLTREPGDVLRVQPWERLTRQDVQAIKRWKWHLLAIADYSAAPPEVQ